MSKKRTIHGIDPYAPGGIEALLAHHRLTFGDAVMEADGDAPPAGDTPPADTPPADAPPATPPADGKPAEWDGKVESLPDGAQKLIRDLRKADGDERVAAKTLAAIQKALNPDAKGEKPDPAKLTEQLTAKDETIRTLTIERALDKAARRAGADEDLLDAVLTRKGSLKELDPSDKDFTKKLDAIVKAELDANPKLKAVLAAGQSGGDFTGGTGEGTKKPTTLEDAVAQKMAR